MGKWSKSVLKKLRKAEQAKSARERLFVLRREMVLAQSPVYWDRVIKTMLGEVEAFNALRPGYLTTERGFNSITVSTEQRMRKLVLEFNENYPIVDYHVFQFTPQKWVEELRGSLLFEVDMKSGSLNVFNECGDVRDLVNTFEMAIKLLTALLNLKQ